MSAYLHAIGTSVPPNKIAQDKVLRFMKHAHRLSSEDARNLEVLYRATGIQYRYSVLKDYEKTENFEFFPPSLEPFPNTQQRQKQFQKHALSVSKSAARKVLHDPASVTHLITVSCTGLHAPGLDIQLVDALGLSPHVHRTAINFMGCYAAVNALKVAEAFCRSDDPIHVLVVCTELCTLHFQKEPTEDNLLANALFGDGSAAALVSNLPKSGALELSEFHTAIEPAGVQEMAWDVGNTGFEMKLSAAVPEHLETGVSNLLTRLGLNDLTQSFDYFAFHPGGKKILNVLENSLNLKKEDNRFSHDILRRYGNMSSPTLLFVLAEIMSSQASNPKPGNVLALAFGPGLTIESMILKFVHP